MAGYHLDDDSSNTITDYSGNGNDGTLQGTPSLQSGPMPVAISTATFTTSVLPAGDNTITAVYEGDENYGAKRVGPQSRSRSSPAGSPPQR